MAHAPHLRSLTVISAMLCLAAGGCDGCDTSGLAGGEESVDQARRPVGSEEEPLVVDGYRVIQSKRRVDEAAERRAAERAHANLVMEPTEPDPQGGSFTLAQAVEGLGEVTDGTLVAEINTDLGTIFCDLYADEVPNTVANFIGLANGSRQWWDARAGAWRARPLYNRSSFFRVIPDYLIQGGDYLEDGTGRIGYTIPDEPNPNRRHDRAGQLCMASYEVNQNGGQFFITDGPRPDLDADSRFTIFGQCAQTDVVERIARVPQNENNVPRTRVEIIRVLVRRVRGGATAAPRSPPVVPENVAGEPRGASPGPTVQQTGGRPEPALRPQPGHEGHGH